MRADLLNKNIPSINNLIAHGSVVVLYGMNLGVELFVVQPMAEIQKNNI